MIIDETSPQAYGFKCQSVEVTMKLTSRIFVFIIVLGVGACAHKHSRGSIVLRHSEDVVDVCLGKDEVQSGDKVIFYNVKCTIKRRGGGRDCTKAEAGRGEVIQALDEHFSSVKVLSGQGLKDGTIVEKIR